MSSTSKTPFLGLNLWLPTDKPTRQDYVDDNALIDANAQLGGGRNSNLIGLNMDSYPRIAGETDDTNRINRAVADASNNMINSNIGRVLYFSEGLYQISSTIFITNRCSLLFHKGAVLQAIAAMGIMISWEGSLGKDLSVYWDYTTYIKGGTIDGNGLAGGLKLKNALHMRLSGTWFKDCIGVGLQFGDTITGGYELFADHLIFRNTITNPNPTTAIYLLYGGDSHFTDIVIVNYTTGVKTTSGSSANKFTRIHVWNTSLNALGSTIAFDDYGGDNHYTECYSDTAKIGWNLNGTGAFGVFITRCDGFNNTGFGLTACTYIKMNVASEPVYIDGGRYAGDGTGSQFYNGQLTDNVFIRDVLCEAGIVNAYSNMKLVNNINIQASKINDFITITIPFGMTSYLYMKAKFFLNDSMSGGIGFMFVIFSGGAFSILSDSSTAVQYIVAQKTVNGNGDIILDIFRTSVGGHLCYTLDSVNGYANQVSARHFMNLFMHFDESAVVSSLPVTGVTTIPIGPYGSDMIYNLSGSIPAASVVAFNTGLKASANYIYGKPHVVLFSSKSLLTSINYFMTAVNQYDVYLAVYNPTASALDVSAIQAHINITY